MSHLLIVDDDPNTLASVSRAFRLNGHEATVADSAARAIELVKSQPFDMIFSDVVMPGQGRDRAARRDPRLGVTTPVVMISGQATLDMAVRATKLGARGFSREAAVYREASADARERRSAQAARAGEQRTAPPGRQARNRLGERRDAPRHGAWWSGLPPANRASAFSARPAPAKNWSRARFTIAARAARGRLSP